MVRMFDIIIFGLLDFNAVLRDTLEYGSGKPQYNAEQFKRRKEAFRKSLDNNQALVNFIKSNGENGQKIKEKLEEVYSMIYGDESTICQLSGEELRVDANQAVTVFDLVLPLREQFNSIIFMHIAETAKKNELSEEIDLLFRADEKFYRAYVWFVVLQEMRKQFIEFNKEIKEANGQPSPQSNFTAQQLQKMENHLWQSRRAARINTRDYSDVVDRVFDYVEVMNGKRVLREGHTFDSDYQDLMKVVTGYIQGADTAWREKFTAAMKAVQEAEKRIREEQQNKQA